MKITIESTEQITHVDGRDLDYCPDHREDTMRGGPPQPFGDLLATSETLARAREIAGVDEVPVLEEDLVAPPVGADETPRPRHEPKACSSCHARLLWALLLDQEGERIFTQDRAGRRRVKSMPVDYEPTPSGNVVVYDRPGEGIACRVLGRGEAPPKGARLRTSHFATCPNAAQHRRRSTP